MLGWWETSGLVSEHLVSPLAHPGSARSCAEADRSWLQWMVGKVSLSEECLMFSWLLPPPALKVPDAPLPNPSLCKPSSVFFWWEINNILTSLLNYPNIYKINKEFGSPFLGGKKPHFRKEAGLMHSKPFTLLIISIFRGVSSQSFLRVMKKWQVEKLVTSEGFWIFTCRARGQEERVVIRFETLSEGTPKNISQHTNLLWALKLHH